MRITASTIKQFLRALPADRRRTVEAMRTVILENIDTPFAEVVQNGAIGYVVPHSVYPAGYHCDPSQPLPFAGTAAQKHHIGLYPFCIYGDPKFEEWFRAAWLKAGKKLDMASPACGSRLSTTCRSRWQASSSNASRPRSSSRSTRQRSHPVPAEPRKKAKTEKPSATKQTAAKKHVTKRT